MKLQRLAIVALVLLVMAMPQVRGSIPCASLTLPASTDSLAPLTETPAAGCSSEAHATMSFAVSCLPCGSALLSDQLFLPKEALRDGLDPVGPLSTSSPLSPPWRPPA